MNTEEFWSNFRREGECLIWTRAKKTNSTHQYGIVVLDGKRWATHRLAWTLTNGPIPEGMFVLHKCDNPPCGEPDHLFIGTQADNMRDLAKKGRARAGPFVPDHAAIIRRLYATGKLSQYDLAHAFGVTRGHIALILQGERWRQDAALP